MGNDNWRAFIVDNSLQSNLSYHYCQAAKDAGVGYIKIPNRGSKAAALNDALAKIGSRPDFVAVFDVDQKPAQDFLKQLIPILKGNPKAAFVQTPQ